MYFDVRTSSIPEVLANKLGFESVEEMEKYFDLCRGSFKCSLPMDKNVKELCALRVIDNGWQELLNAPREERLEKKIHFDFDKLVEIMKSGDDESEQQIKDLIDFELSELKKCYANREQKTRKLKMNCEKL